MSDSSHDSDAHDEAYCASCSRSFAFETVTCPHDGSRLVKLAATRDELLGKVLDDRYEIRAPLGKGGMGTVYRGWQLSVDREVAIKVIHPKLSSDVTTVKRFLRETRLASRLSQPNIVNVYDFGQADGILYLVMELLRGHTLSTELGRGRRLNVRRVAVIGQQLCDALEAAHAQDIVHRDLKPGNIVILDDPPGRDLIKVLDFGLAKSLVTDNQSITNTDAVIGTPLYMAPEQVEGKPTDQRTDLYALGCIFYEMLSGAPPFVDAITSAVLARHLTQPPAPLPSHVPPQLARLVERLLAKRPPDRVQSAGDVRETLQQVLASPAFRTPMPGALSSSIPDTVPDIPSPLAETAMATTPASPRPPVPRRWPLVIALAAVVVGATAITIMIGRRGTAPAPIDAAAIAPRPIDAPGAPDAVGDAALDAPIDAPRAPIDAPRRIAHPPVPHPPPPPPPTPPPPTPPPPRAIDAGVPALDFYKPTKK